MIRTRLATAFAPGKLIISGEHSVVHGHPALAMALDRGCTIHLFERPGRSAIDDAPIRDQRLEQAVLPLLPPEGIGVEIESNIPIGRGMGSSASMSIALIQALAEIEGQQLSFSALHERGFRLERVFHGTPSGIDHAVSALGGMLCYQRTPDGAQMRQIHTRLPPVIVLDSGTSGNTAEQVGKVRAMGEAGAKICAEIGTLTESIIDKLAHGDPAQLGQGMTHNHHLLSSLGVSNPRLDAMVELCIEAGAYGAKLAGAGGGGVVMAITDQPQSVLAAAAQAGYSAFQTSLHPVRMELP